MKLTLESIKKISVGTAYVDEMDGKISLHRFTKKQEELYSTVDDDLYKKVFATAGVRLEFFTDSQSLALEVEVSPASSRCFFEHSIHINGKKLTGLGCRQGTGVFSGKWVLPEGEKKVTLYFPWSVASKILSLELDDNSSLTPVEKKCTMISFGDSITHGYDCSSPECSYASILADALEANSRNKGIGAEIFRPQLARLADDITPDYVTVAYGTNDWWSGMSEEKLRNGCREFYKAISENYPTAKIFAISPIWRHNWLTTTNAGKFYKVHEIISEETANLPNVIVIDGIDLIPHSPDNFSPDILHPNDKGFACYGTALANEIKKHI